VQGEEGVEVYTQPPLSGRGLGVGCGVRTLHPTPPPQARRRAVQNPQPYFLDYRGT